MKNKRILSASLTLFLVLNLSAAFFFSAPVLAATPKVNNNTRVAVGDRHALLLDGEGNIWAFGNNDDRQLGDGTNVSRPAPVIVYHKSWKGRAISVAAGSRQSLALLENGTVLAWGNGSSEQKIVNLDNVTAISAGQDICMAILESGYVVCWSDSMEQQAVEDSDGFPLINIGEISVGSNDLIILRDDIDGTVYQLAHGDYKTAEKVTVTIDIDSNNSSDSSSVSDDNSSDYSSHGYSYTTSLKDAVSVSAGADFGIALLRSGDVYSWGSSSSGALGQGYIFGEILTEAKKINNLSNIAKISAGFEHAIVKSESGEIFGWGDGNSRQVDPKTTSVYTSPEKINLGIDISQFECGTNFNLGISDAGDFYSWGDSKGLEKLALKQTFLKVAAPKVKAIDIKDSSITVTWDINEYFIEFAAGFLITYTMPDGTVGKTQLLPLNTSQITLLGLQAATNYRINMSVIGKTGYEDKLPVFVVQTAKAVEISPSPAQSAVSGGSSVNSQSGTASNLSGTNSEEPGGRITSLLSLIIIIIVLLMLVAAVIAIIYVWRKMKKDDSSRIKSVRVSPEENIRDAQEIDEDMIVSNKTAYIEKPEDLEEPSIALSSEETAEKELLAESTVIAAIPPGADSRTSEEELYESLIENQMGSSETDETDATDATDETDDEELPEIPLSIDDEDDDFITRKPGEPKNNE